MQVLEVTALGGPQHLAFRERPMPEPGPQDCIVRMQAATLNFRDYALLLGRSASKARVPYIPLSDGCGIVESVGSEVTAFRPGDAVVPSFFQSWQDGAPSAARISQPLGTPLDGVACAFMAVKESGLVKLPAHLSPVEGAALPCAGLTAWRALTDGAKLWPGDVVLVQGTGGVSIFALQFAVAAGLTVIVTSSSDAKLERARALGAHHTINYVETPDWAAAARRITGGRGVDLVLEVGGAGTIQQSLAAIRVGGEIAVIGMLSGMEQTVNVGAIYASNAHLRGITVGSRDMLARMCAAMEAHRVVPVIGSTYAFADARGAFEALAHGSHFGKIALTLPG